MNTLALITALLIIAAVVRLTKFVSKHHQGGRDRLQ